MPEHEFARLMTLNIGITLSVILAVMIGTWAIIRTVTRSSGDIASVLRDTANAVRDVATMQREVSFMIRRQYGDIDRDLQEIKELLGER